MSIQRESRIGCLNTRDRLYSFDGSAGWDLADLFRGNFKKSEAGVNAAVTAAGP